MSKVVEYIIKLGGNAQTATSKLKTEMNDLCKSVDRTQGLFSKLSSVSFGFNNIVGAISTAKSSLSGFTSANQAQQEAESKLAQVMKNTMDASDAEIQSIKNLTAAQQKLGVVGDEVQLAGAQELGTYLEKSSSLEKLIPVMNDMIAQQYGYNATQESAVNIATMMGKVMEGQTGALSRYGYSFTTAQEAILKYGTEAQKVATLTQVITESVGGMNEALAQTPEGVGKQMANNLGDLQERVGGLINRIIVALAPAIEKVFSIADNLMTWLESKLGWVESLISIAYDFRYMLLAVGGAIGALISITKVWQAVQTVMNVVMSANPIGLVIIAIAALIGLIATIIVKWNEWGAKVSAFLGIINPGLAILIHTIQTFRANWQSIIDAFKNDGIVAGIKRIGQVLLMGILSPLKTILEVAAKIPKVGKWAQAGVDKINALGDKWGVEDNTKPKAATAGTGINDKLAAATATKGNGLSGVSGTQSSDTTAVATGGTRNTEIHINIGDMIKQVVFNGTTAENKQEIERNFAECLYRVLGMAQASVG